MNRVTLILLLIFGIGSSVFARQSEVWQSFGLSFENYFENGVGLENTYVGSLGVNFSLYSFTNNSNIGLFAAIGFISFSVAGNHGGGYALGFRRSLVIGPGFRRDINENLAFHSGLGLSFQWLLLSNSGSGSVIYHDSRWLFGIGGDIGFKYSFTDAVHVRVGANVSYYFANNRRLDRTDDNWGTTVRISDGWVENYFKLGISPYISIGFNSYGTQRRGRPTRE
ncbi:MAG: hypothetical protein FWC64_02440 [Treponema sp.]|nr:hypothetical protein [Treponema sp.]